MANSIYTASITVNFSKSDEANDILKAEIDARENGYNSGRSKFIPGVDDPVILVYKSTPVTITGMDVTAGNLNSLGHGSILVEEYVEFNKEREVTVTYPISNSFTSKWVGVDGGPVSFSENNISLPSEVLGALKISYNSVFEAFRLVNVPAVLDSETEFPVLIYIVGEA